MRFKKIISFLLPVVIFIPYFINISQDASIEYKLEELHDEAAFHLNAKDIVTFGLPSIKNERLTGIVMPVHTMFGLIFFSLFGCSLWSMRIGYILLNVIGNLCLFHLMKKRCGVIISLIAVIAFSYYPQRLVIGRVGMAESFVLPLTLIILYCFTYLSRSVKVYFSLGALGILSVIAKVDNVFFFAFLIMLSLYTAARYYKKRKYDKAVSVIKYFTFGAVSVFLLFALFWGAGYMFFGQALVDEFKYIFSNVITANLDITNAWQKDDVSAISRTYASNIPLRPELLEKNLQMTFSALPQLSIVTVVCLILFLYNLFTRKKKKLDPLELAIISVLFLYLAKMSTLSIFLLRRTFTSIELPFMLIAYDAVLVKEYLASKDWQRFFWENITGHKIKLYFNRAAISLMLIGILLYIFDDKARSFLKKVFITPAYKIQEESKYVNSIIADNEKAVFIDGRFSYLALLSPSKFIDVPPSPGKKNFFDIEAAPELVISILDNDRSIKYAFVRNDYIECRKILESRYHGKILRNDITEYGYFYRLERDY